MLSRQLYGPLRQPLTAPERGAYPRAAGLWSPPLGTTLACQKAKSHPLGGSQAQGLEALPPCVTGTDYARRGSGR